MNSCLDRIKEIEYKNNIIYNKYNEPTFSNSYFIDEMTQILMESGWLWGISYCRILQKKIVVTFAIFPEKEVSPMMIKNYIFQEKKD